MPLTRIQTLRLKALEVGARLSIACKIQSDKKSLILSDSEDETITSQRVAELSELAAEYLSAAREWRNAVEKEAGMGIAEGLDPLCGHDLDALTLEIRETSRECEAFARNVHTWAASARHRRTVTHM